ncbi:MAG: YafY family transcriptional regulator [Rhodobacteraceae bacterium]|nr:YafY family transcriptional regulator [Paracoccaceae bacterium]
MLKSHRLMQVMQILRSQPPPIRAEDLAFELHVSQRCIYRDITALRGMGAIIDGEAGFGYTLTEDPALPPMMFSHDEIEALVLGLREVRHVGDPVLAKAADNALSKIKATLPDRLRGQLDHAILYTKRFQDRPKISIDVSALRAAIRAENMIEISYSDAKQAISQRQVLPLGIVYMDAVLMLMAWCNLRQDFRAFRLDRIQTLTKTDTSFRPRRAAMLRDCFQHFACP